MSNAKQELLSVLLRGIEGDMRIAAEPLIAEALQKIEKAMREKVAAAVMARLDMRYSAERMQDTLVITVNLAGLQP